MERSIRYSKKREAILAAIQGTSCHPSAERFDAVVTPHSHFVCEYCGAVIDLPHLTLDSEMDHAVSQQYGLMVYRHELTLHGLCPDCIKQKKSKEETRS